MREHQKGGGIGVGFALVLGRCHSSKTGRQLSELGGGAASDAGVHPISGVVQVLMDKHIIPPISHLPTRRVKQMEGSAEPASLTAKEVEEVKTEQLSFESELKKKKKFSTMVTHLDVNLLPLNVSGKLSIIVVLSYNSKSLATT